MRFALLLTAFATQLVALGCVFPDPPEGSGGSDGLPHQDLCFALEDHIYPHSFELCELEYGGDFPRVFACLDTPPEESCQPFSPTYPDRFCCCDPARSAKCVFYIGQRDRPEPVIQGDP